MKNIRERIKKQKEDLANKPAIKKVVKFVSKIKSKSLEHPKSKAFLLSILFSVPALSVNPEKQDEKDTTNKLSNIKNSSNLFSKTDINNFASKHGSIPSTKFNADTLALELPSKTATEFCSIFGSLEGVVKQNKSMGYNVIYDNNESIISATLISGKDSVILYRSKNYNGDFIYCTEDGMTLDNCINPVPVKGGKITSKFNPNRMHPVLKVVRPHEGIDISQVNGTPIEAASNGVVVNKGFQKNGYGNYIEIEHGTVDGKKITTFYAHMKKATNLEIGAEVKKGDTIGNVGNTGISNGKHLHFETRRDGKPFNPLAGITFVGERQVSDTQLADLQINIKTLSELNKTYVVSLEELAQAQLKAKKSPTMGS